MKLIDYLHYEDYGHEWYLNILTSRRFSLIEFAVNWNEYPSPEIFPLLLLSIGSRGLVGFTFSWKSFDFRFECITTCPRHLDKFRTIRNDWMISNTNGSDA